MRARNSVRYLALVLLFVPLAWSEPIVRYHGFKMDPQYRLVIEEENGLVKIGLLSRARDEGGPNPEKAAETSVPLTSEPNPFRSAKKENLIEVRAEALQASAPNALKNPAQRYRIIMRGVDLEPEYAAIIETDASTAREKFYKEMGKLEARTDGIHRQALHDAASLTLGVLGEAGKMPADITETVKHSAVAQTRGLGPTLQRRSLDTGRRLDPMAAQKPETSALPGAHR
ncbi:MAG: hypothetical protein HZB26_14470 [Candidatus Hydrogenedentes bacterium]|nr:hypothetical protein [Candidatus Hydrogenedentota bacterium]